MASYWLRIIRISNDKIAKDLCSFHYLMPVLYSTPIVLIDVFKIYFSIIERMPIFSYVFNFVTFLRIFDLIKRI